MKKKKKFIVVIVVLLVLFVLMIGAIAVIKEKIRVRNVETKYTHELIELKLSMRQEYYDVIEEYDRLTKIITGQDKNYLTPSFRKEYIYDLNDLLDEYAFVENYPSDAVYGSMIEENRERDIEAIKDHFKVTYRMQETIIINKMEYEIENKMDYDEAIKLYDLFHL